MTETQELCLKHHIEKVEQLYEDGNSMSSNWVCPLCDLVNDTHHFNKQFGSLNEPTKDLIRNLIMYPITKPTDIKDIVESIERIAKYTAVVTKNEIINVIKRS